MEVNKLDPILHERVRLGIVGLLLRARELDFQSLRMALNVTYGNLASHLRKLEENNIIKVRKTFVGRRPRTYYQLTDEGKRRFLNYLENLKKILGEITEKEVENDRQRA